MDKPKTVDLGTAFAHSGSDPFWAIRGHAIQAYADIEQSLCMLFAHLAGVKHDVAGLIFFRITNTRAVGEILKDLLQKKHGDTYSKFWKSFARLAHEAIDTRNRVVQGQSRADRFKGLTPSIVQGLDYIVLIIGAIERCEENITLRTLDLVADALLGIARHTLRVRP